MFRFPNTCERMFVRCDKNRRKTVLTSLTEILRFILWLALGIFVTINQIHRFTLVILVSSCGLSHRLLRRFIDVIFRFIAARSLV